MRFLVTGATGLVGSELTRQLLVAGHSGRILRRQDSDKRLLQAHVSDVEEVVGDVTDYDSVQRAVAGVDTVFHTAAYIGFRGQRDLQQLRRVNVGGTANVVDACLRCGVGRMVHTSSMAAFGRPENPDGVIDEGAEWHSSASDTQYAVSKYLAELEVYRGIAEGLDAVMVNPSVIFGEGRPGENTRALVDKIRKRRLPVVPIGGTNVVDVRDVADGHLKALERGRTGERYFLGSQNLYWGEIFATIAAAFDVQPPRVKMKPWLWTGIAILSEALGALPGVRPIITRETVRNASRFFRYDNAKAVSELGCTFRPFSETADWIAAAVSGASH